MSNLKFRANISTFVSRQKCSSIFNNCDNLLCGIYNCDEFRTILEFNLSPKLLNSHISRAEVVIFISCLKIDDNIESFMLNFAKNTMLCSNNHLTYNEAPLFFQDSSFSKITTQVSNNYIRIDISKIVKYWLKRKCTKFGITLLGLAQNSIIYIDNKNKKPFLDINIDECANPCNYESIYFNQQYAPQKNTYNSNNTCTNQEKAFGIFTSTSGELNRLDGFSYTKFNFENCLLNSNLNQTKDGIIILKKGIYKVDYMVNCICEDFTTMCLELNVLELKYTKVQISINQSITSTSTLIETCEDNSILKLKISTSNALLLCTGNCASITIDKIN